MTDLVLTRHTYIPVLSSFAETMLVPTRAKDTRQDDPSGTTGKENERRERNTRTRRGYAFARAVRFGLRCVHACVRACVRHKNNAIAPLPRRVSSNYDTTGRARSRRKTTRHTYAYLHVYTHIYRGTHAPFEAHASPETRMVASLFAKIRAKKKRRVGAGRSRKKTTRARRVVNSRDLQRSRGPSAFSVDARVRSSRDRTRCYCPDSAKFRHEYVRVLRCSRKFTALIGKYRYQKAITQMNDTNDDSFVTKIHVIS